MRMRTLPATMKVIREADPDTAITPWALRNMVLSGEIPTVLVGRKRLIDVDKLPEYMTPAVAPVTPIASGTIRRVDL